MAQYLIQNGANVEVLNDYHFSPVYFAPKHVIQDLGLDTKMVSNCPVTDIHFELDETIKSEFEKHEKKA